MAQSISHAAQSSSTASNVYADLERSFRRNRARVASLRELAMEAEGLKRAALLALVGDLNKYPGGDRRDLACMGAVFAVLNDGPEAELSREELRYLAVIGVPRELIVGSTRGRG